MDEFRAAFDRTYPRAERVALRITGDSAVAQELAAETLTRLYVRWRRMAAPPYVDAWVLRVTINLSIGTVRLSDLSEADVAAALGVSTGTVKTHLHRGLTSLRARLAVD